MRSTRPHSLHEFIQRLRKHNELVEVTAPVDPVLELAEIHRRVVKENGPALLFTHVQGSQFPVATNLFSSKKRLNIAFGEDVYDRVHNSLRFLTRDFPSTLSSAWAQRKMISSFLRLGTRTVSSAPLLYHSQTPPDLDSIPFIKCWPDDGGSFLTLPMVYTESPLDGRGNLGMYRIQRYDSSTTGLHWQVAKGGGYHFYESEQRGTDLPVTIFLGGSPAVIASSIAPLPENISELVLASFLLEDKLSTCHHPSTPHPLIAECDAALVGHATANERRLEGPFGDHYGYQSPALPFPVFHCSHLFHRSDAIIPATVVGRPLQEDAFLGQFVQGLLRPFISLLIPSVQDLYTYPETGFHPLAVARVKERYEKEALSTSLRLLGEGQLSLTKILMITDQCLPLDSIQSLLPSLLERLRPEEDILILSYTSFDTLDMTGPKPNRGSKAIFLGTGQKRRDLPTCFTFPLPDPICKALPFCPGCLVLDGPSYEALIDPSSLAQERSFSQWPLLILVDDAELCCSSPGEFLWQACTRFEPAKDIYAKKKSQERNGVSFSFPLLIDARIKPSYPSPLIPDPATVEHVDNRWHEYFPSTSPS